MNQLIPKASWIEQIQKLKRKKSKLPTQEKLVVFYGSSSIRYWVRMPQDLAPFNVFNMGFGGSSFKWCLYFFEELFEGLTPHQIVLYAGDNDLMDDSMEEIKGYYQELLSKITTTYPNTSLAQISLKPSPERVELLPEVQHLNQYFEQTMKELNGSFINIYTDMLTDSGDTRPELFREDGLHMNRQGYEVWIKRVNKHLKETV